MAQEYEELHFTFRALVKALYKQIVESKSIITFSIAAEVILIIMFGVFIVIEILQRRKKKDINNRLSARLPIMFFALFSIFNFIVLRYSNKVVFPSAILLLIWVLIIAFDKTETSKVFSIVYWVVYLLSAVFTVFAIMCLLSDTYLAKELFR